MTTRLLAGLTSVIFILQSCSRVKEADRYPEGIQHVVVIGVDGLSPDGIRRANTPVIHGMIAGGAVKWNVRTVLPSSSSPNWASMIMGAGPEQHGVLENDWERDQFVLPPVVMGEEGIFPTIFGVVHQARPGEEIGAVYHWDGFGRLFEKKAVNYDHHFSTEDSSAADFISYLKRSQPLFAFLHFDHVDHAGHAYGHGTQQYLDAVSKADSLIGRVLEGIKAAGMEENTLVILTADHGGKGFGHGGPTTAEAEIAMVFHGKDVKKGYRIQQQVYTYDLAASIAFALHISPPYAWIGRPVKSAFEGFTEPDNLWVGKQVIASPIIYPAAYLYRQAGALSVDTPATVTMKAVADSSFIRYTLDGSEPDSNSTRYRQPFTLDSTAVVKARAYDSAGNASLTSVAYFRSVRSAGGNGLQARLYKGKEWKTVPAFETLHPASIWTTAEFTIPAEKISDTLTSGNNSFGMVFSGFIQVDRPGDYTFSLLSDDGSRLFIGNRKVVDNDGSHGLGEKSGSVRLTAGRHPITLEYFNGYGGFWLDAFYQGPGIPRQLVPANKLFLKP